MTAPEPTPSQAALLATARTLIFDNDSAVETWRGLVIEARKTRNRNWFRWVPEGLAEAWASLSDESKVTAMIVGLSVVNEMASWQDW